MSYRIVTLFALCLVASACIAGAEIPVRGVVLGPGQSVEATNKFGSVRVSYVAPTARKFEWDSRSRVVKMIARPEPFLGELGIYDGARCYVIVMPLCRTPRLVVREAIHDFKTYDEIYAFLREGSAIMDWVYTSDGLLVGFGRADDRSQINVDLRQITLNGHKPTGLRGARDADIKLTSR